MRTVKHMGWVALALGLCGLGCSSKGQACHYKVECGQMLCAYNPITKAKTCEDPCKTNADCGSAALVCSPSGECNRMPPTLKLLEPSNTTLTSDEITEVSGTVSFWGSMGSVDVVATALSNTCATGPFTNGRAMTVSNLFGKDSFVLDQPFRFTGIRVPPGQSTLTATLRVDTQSAVGKEERTLLAPTCATCPQVNITAPASGTQLGATTLVLSNLTGTTTATNVPCGTWRIYSPTGEYTQGVVPITASAFGPMTLPLFPGTNVVEVEVGSPPGACVITVSTAEAAPVAARVMLSWDSLGDMDTHLVRPGGTYSFSGVGVTDTDCYFANCPGGSLTWGANHVQLDIDNTHGYGPENIRLTGLESGVYGVLIHPYSGQSNVTVRTYLGSQQVGVVGPCFLGHPDVLVVGTIEVAGTSGTFRTLNQLVDGPPTTSPSSWTGAMDAFGPDRVARSCPPVTRDACGTDLDAGVNPDGG